MQTQLATVEAERLLVALAEAQHGVVARSQLLRLGLRRSAIGHRIRLGRLHPAHRGVYAVGHPLLTERGHWMAAVLACGLDAVLSHTSAAAAWDLRPSASERVDVTLPTRSGRAARAGLRIHRRASLPASEVTRQGALPVTSFSRTLVDLASVLPGRALERALERAEVLRRFDLAALDASLENSGNAPGTAVLRRLLARKRPAASDTRSELERRFLELVARHRLPRPLVNHRLGAFEVDFLWPQAGLVVETDGREHHGTTAAFERDRARDARLALDGYLVLRFTYRQVTRDAQGTAATLATILERRTAGAP